MFTGSRNFEWELCVCVCVCVCVCDFGELTCTRVAERSVNGWERSNERTRVLLTATGGVHSNVRFVDKIQRASRSDMRWHVPHYVVPGKCLIAR